MGYDCGARFTGANGVPACLVCRHTRGADPSVPPASACGPRLTALPPHGSRITVYSLDSQKGNHTIRPTATQASKNPPIPTMEGFGSSMSGCLSQRPCRG